MGLEYLVEETAAGGSLAAPISMIEPPLTRRNFHPVCLNGLGDSANAYAHAMGWFQDHLYVGFTRYVYYGLRPYDLSHAFEVFPVNVPDPIRRIQLTSQGRAQIWRFSPKEAKWENVHVSPMCMGSRGFEVAKHIGFRNMLTFRGASDPSPALYATSWGSHMGKGPFLLRCIDGKTFEEVGADDRGYFGTQTLRVLATLKGKLFTIPTERDSGEDGAHDFQGGVVLECSDPAVGGWRPISEPFFNDSGNIMLFEMTAFNGFLYVGTGNPYEGFQLWKTDAEGTPPYRWKKVLSHGAYRGKLNEGIASMCVFKDHLYLGTGIYGGGFDRINDVGPAASELIRINADDEWELLVGEPRQTPEGLKVPLSGFGAGWNNPFVGYLWRMCGHDGWLYAGTLVWSSWLPYSRFDRCPDKLKGMIDAVPLERFMKHFGGFDLWRSRDGVYWKPVTNNGFDNQYNCGTRTMVSSPYGIFIGSANQFGPDVAMRRTHGWKYEANPKAGAEVWMGTHEPIEKKITIGPLLVVPEEARPQRRKIHVSVEDKDLISEFYDQSGWRHVGFWGSEIDDPVQACENLMKEVMAFIRPTAVLSTPRPPTQEELKAWIEGRSPAESSEDSTRFFADKSVLDVGCGLGQTTARLCHYFPEERVVGATPDKRELTRIRHYVPAADIRYMRLPSLKFSKETFDVAVCLEGPGRYGKREKLFKEICRVLKPGGQLVGTDILLADRKDKPLSRDGAYRALLEKAGFEDVQVEDVTQKSVEPFLRKAHDFFERKVITREIDQETMRKAMASLPGYSRMIDRYLLLTARKNGADGPEN